jgi:hypothetical protein
MANFLFLLFVLNIILYKPIRKIIKRRNNEISSFQESIDSLEDKALRNSRELEKDMENAMMSALLPQMKQKMLKEEEILLAAKECFGKADTLKEAKICSHNMDEPGDDEGDDLTDWSDKTKKETLGFIDQGLESMACVKKAETMDAIKQCMSQE